MSRPPAPPAEQLLQLLLAQAEDYSLFLMNADGVICDWYHGAEHIFGFSAEEIVGEKAHRLFNQDDIQRGAPDHELEWARNANRAEDDRWHVRKDGTLFWGSGVTLAIRGEKGEVVGFAKIARNRTDLKSQTEALENQLAAHQARAEQGKVFLATIAHELRNLLAPMTNGMSLMRVSLRDDPTSSAAAKILDRQIEAFRRLVDDLMDHTRAETGKLTLQWQVLDLRHVAEVAAESARPLAEGREHVLELVMISTPVQVLGDSQRLHQVVFNLLSNAVKYTPPGGKILVTVTTEGGDAILRVEDTGVGMSADMLPRVFDLFTQEHASAALAQGGVGLGLPLVRELTQMHHGTVQARSDGRGKGSVFTVRLPVHEATQV